MCVTHIANIASTTTACGVCSCCYIAAENKNCNIAFACIKKTIRIILYRSEHSTGFFNTIWNTSFPTHPRLTRCWTFLYAFLKISHICEKYSYPGWISLPFLIRLLNVHARIPKKLEKFLTVLIITYGTVHTAITNTTNCILHDDELFFMFIFFKSNNFPMKYIRPVYRIVMCIFDDFVCGRFGWRLYKNCYSYRYRPGLCCGRQFLTYRWLFDKTMVVSLRNK